MRIRPCGSRPSAPPASSARRTRSAFAKAVEKDLQDRFLAYTYQQTMTTLEGLVRRESTTTANAPAEANTTATALPDLSAAAMRRDLRDKGVQNDHHRHDARADALRRPLVRGRGRQARAADADQRRLHAPQRRHRPAGSIDAIGNAAATMPAPSAANARAYVPDLPVVLAGITARPARRVRHDQVHGAGASRANTPSSARSPATGCACTASCWSCRVSTASRRNRRCRTIR